MDERDGGGVGGKGVNFWSEIGEKSVDDGFRGNNEKRKMEGKHGVVDKTHAEERVEE